MQKISRRQAITRGLTTAAAIRIAHPARASDAEARPKIRIGIIGCGKRSEGIIAPLLTEHGGYEIVGAADYFADRAQFMATHYKLTPDQTFTGLQCARKMIAKGGLDAVAIISPPYFHPEQAAAAVDADLHVFLAKPIAVDVPGCRSIKDSAARATRKGLTFLVDFQTRADPFFTEAIKRVHAGALGEIVFGEASYHCGRLAKKTDENSPEGRLRNWMFDKALSGDVIVEQNIHTLDVMSWAMNNVPPLRCTGLGGRKVRVDVGDCWDYFTHVFEYAHQVGVTFSSRQYTVDAPGGIINKMYGSRGALLTEYGGNVIIRGDADVFYRGGRTSAIYREGPAANIKAFHEAILTRKNANTTVEPSYISNLVSIMGRMAAYSGRTVTWEEVVNSTERLDGRLEGLTA